MNKASGGDGIPVELFQILKHDATQAARMFLQELYQKAGVVDNRYLFF